MPGSRRVHFAWAVVATVWLACAGRPVHAALRLLQVQGNTNTLFSGNDSRNVALPTTLKHTSASFLVFSYRNTNNSPADMLVTGRIVSTTNLIFERYGATGADASIRWYAAEFSGGAFVQHGSYSFGVGESIANVPITAVNTSKAFPLISYRNAGGTYNNDDFVRASLSSSTTLTLRRECSACVAPENGVVQYQVVQLEGTAVQSGSGSFLTSATSSGNLISPAVPLGRGWLVYSWQVGGSASPDIGRAMIRGRFTSSTRLTFDRVNTGITIDYNWHLVAFDSGVATVQNFDGALYGVTTSGSSTISPAVNLTKAFSAGGGTGSAMRTSYAADDHAGAAFCRHDITTSTTDVGHSRGSALGNGDCAFQVVEFVVTGTEVKLQSFDARPDPKGVGLTWTTHHELHNLGFHVYREENGRRVRLNENLIPGASLLSRSPAPMLGRTYTFRDARRPRGELRYWIEDVDLSGRRTWHGPAVLRAADAEVDAPIALARAALTLAPTPHDPWTAVGVQPKGWPSSSMLRERRGPTWSQVISGRRALKLGVRENGWYRLTGRDLSDAGFGNQEQSASAPASASLRLFVDGEEQALLVNDGGDGRLDAEDTLEFFGAGLDDLHTDTRAHWLLSAPGRARRVRPATVGTSQNAITWYPAIAHLRERTIYFAALRNGDTSNFFGAVVRADPVARTLRLDSIASPEEQRLEVSVQGVTAGAHRVQIKVNGVLAGQLQFDGQLQVRELLALPPGTLRDGDNVVTLQAQADEQDVVLLDELRLEYRRGFVADQGALTFSAAGYASVPLRGFEAQDLRVFDVTDPRETLEIEAMSPTLSLPRWPDGAERRYLAVNERAIRRPVSLHIVPAPRWTGTPTQPGDFVVIGPRALLGA